MNKLEKLFSFGSQSYRQKFQMSLFGTLLFFPTGYFYYKMHLIERFSGFLICAILMLGAAHLIRVFYYYKRWREEEAAAAEKTP